MSSSTPHPEIISMEFSTGGRDNCYYRILAGRHVKYITVEPGVLDAESLMDMASNFANILPPLPYFENNWNQAHIHRATPKDELKATLSQGKLASVDTVWHPTMIDFMALRKTERLTLLAEETVWQREPHAPQTIIAKMATSSGRSLLDQRPTGPDDVAVCRAELGRMHSHGILHGDVNRYNFLIGGDGAATLIDFEKPQLGADKAALEKEMAGLEWELRDESGRGGGFMEEEEREEIVDAEYE
ncbi:hypothetical protein LMH87_002882 [Akanthomyces muscarius]|uniref:Aminoglycoside phosphotransferase domain-containing protein n=1 Tax=Akanthomyces muscarius TaxID=2231603 RepID=A0A9W8QAF6_AKAMU|nr:hypothetical protein LMH87_002882 [Akanthomyces muscarius]KAJ4148411.1 hypothetical protein LMH87_002882 [Akanthomyces muscarius]